MVATKLLAGSLLPTAGFWISKKLYKVNSL